MIKVIVYALSSYHDSLKMISRCTSTQVKTALVKKMNKF